MLCTVKVLLSAIAVLAGKPCGGQPFLFPLDELSYCMFAELRTSRLKKLKVLVGCLHAWHWADVTTITATH